MTYLDGKWGYLELHEASSAHADRSPEEVAALVLRRTTKVDLLEFATRYMTETIRGIRRAQVQSMERASSRIVDTRSASPFEIELAERWAHDEEADRLERSLPRTFGAWKDRPYPVLSRRAEREGFRSGFPVDEWRTLQRHWEDLADAGQLVTTHQQFERDGEWDRDRVRSDWWHAGPTAYWAMRRRKQILRLVEDEGRRVRIEVTAELLRASFALRDGTLLTWGAATVAQHTQRIELLVGNASGNIEAASRHQAAIDAIRAADVSCLSELR